MCNPPVTEKLLPVVTKLEIEQRVASGELLIVYKEQLYNVTKFAKSHPGGELILKHFAGRDATDAMIAYHSDKVHKMIKFYLVGDIDKKEWKSPKISAEYRKLNQKLEQEGFYKPNLDFYKREVFKFFILWTGMLYFAVTANGRFWMYAISALLGGALWQQAAFVAHDCGHSGVSHNMIYDEYFGILLANFMGGLSLGWWKHNHNIHHVVTNSPEDDPDIQHLPFFAVTTRFFNNLKSSYYDRVMKFDLASKAFVSLQHYLFYIVMMFGRFNLYALSINHLVNHPNPRNRNLEVLGMLCFWTWHLWLLSHLPSIWHVLLYVFVSHGVTALLHVQITISHFGMPTEHVQDEDFASKALRTSMDVECPTWLDWFHGGLQFQVIHHLFPRIPRSNLRRVKPLIQEFAKQNGKTYHSHGFVKSNSIVLGTLRQVASQVRFLATVADSQITEIQSNKSL